MQSGREEEMLQVDSKETREDSPARTNPLPVATVALLVSAICWLIAFGVVHPWHLVVWFFVAIIAGAWMTLPPEAISLGRRRRVGEGERKAPEPAPPLVGARLVVMLAVPWFCLFMSPVATGFDPGPGLGWGVTLAAGVAIGELVGYTAPVGRRDR
jgi:hypothetical protein